VKKEILTSLTTFIFIKLTEVQSVIMS